MVERGSWPFDEPPTLGVFVTVDVIEGGATPTLVEHDEDGDWSISAGLPFEVENVRVVHLGWVAHQFDVVWDAARLPLGRGIEFDAATGAWTEHDVVLTD